MCQAATKQAQSVAKEISITDVRGESTKERLDLLQHLSFQKSPAAYTKLYVELNAILVS